MRAPKRLRYRIVADWRQCRRRPWSPAGAFRRCCDRAGAGRRRHSAAAASATAMPMLRSATRNMKRPMARASGGNTNHRPAQENARKSPSAVASAASAGHNRSHNRLPRARASARASKTRVGMLPIVRLVVQASSKSRSVARARENLSFTNANTHRPTPGHACILCALKPIAACDRAQSIGQLQGAAAPGPIPRR